MNLFQRGDFTLASGQESQFKIDCDALDQDDIDSLAWLINSMFNAGFGHVEGVPTGGLRLAEALERYCRPEITARLLIVDDVWTTGGSMRKQRAGRYRSIGAVLFARHPVDSWVFPLFRMYS